MKNLEYICMAIVFVMAAISLVMWYGKGVHFWIWQFNAMMWVGVAFLQKRRLDKLEDNG